MFRKIALGAASTLGLLAGGAFAEGGAHIEDHAFAHEGPFGKFDEFQLQRGLQVFTEVCSACHGLKYVPVRTLSDEGGPRMPEDQVRAYAKDMLPPVADPVTGEERPREVSDKFPENTGAGAPDLSLMTKARAGFHGPYGLGINQMMKGMGGPEYVYSILTGYAENPACAPDGIDGYYYNTAFANGGIPDSCKDEAGHSTITGSWIAMAPPLSDDIVTYADGHAATVHHTAEDVTSFLTWAAEPKMMARKQAGLTAIIILSVLTVLLYLTNKTLWAGVKGKKKAH
ncbi:cytochrome c1 [Neogemmobacter tilapiae]|nr:cytochrome c1 [Gemmobacter tilapiae]